MNLRIFRRPLRSLKAVLLTGALLLPMGGCPIDSDALIADVVRAALESATNSFIETLSTYLAGN
jgi:hypothetical protein